MSTALSEQDVLAMRLRARVPGSLTVSTEIISLVSTEDQDARGFPSQKTWGGAGLAKGRREVSEMTEEETSRRGARVGRVRQVWQLTSADAQAPTTSKDLSTWSGRKEAYCEPVRQRKCRTDFCVNRQEGRTGVESRGGSSAGVTRLQGRAGQCGQCLDLL